MPINHNYLRLKGLEPITFWSVVRCSIQLSYKRQKWQDSNPRHPALETSALPTELHFLRVEGIEPSSSGWKPNRLPLTYTRIINRNGVIRTRDPLLPKQMRYQAALRSVPLTGIEPVPLPRKGNVLTTRRKGHGESRIWTYVNKCCLIYSQMPLTTQPSLLGNVICRVPFLLQLFFCLYL